MAALGVKKSTARELLHPEVLSHLKNLDLVARSVVEGFLIGLHRSPRFGFSQEFAEYRSYAVMVVSLVASPMKRVQSRCWDLA